MQADARYASVLARRIGRSCFAQSVIAGLIVALLCLIPLTNNTYFYFRDDFQTSLLPVFLEIGSNLKNGELHWLSARTWFGGHFAGEYQYGAFNPISLIVYAIVDEFDDLRAAATFLALFHIFILASGLAFFARLLHSNFSASLLAALIGCTSSWLLYWGATTWIPAVISIAWMSWAAAFLLLTFRSKRWMSIAAIFCGLTFLSGWISSNLALVIFSTVCVLYGFKEGAEPRALLRVMLSVALGVGLSMPALTSTLGYLDVATRQISQLSSGWQVQLQHLFFWSVPSHLGLWVADGHVRIPTDAPVLYGSWVCLAAPLWQLRSSLWRDHRVHLTVLVIGTSAILSMMPSVWHLRWSFKFLAWFHIGLALLTAVLLSSAGRTEGRDALARQYGRLLLVLGSLYLLTFMLMPELWKLHTVAAPVLFFSVLLTFAVSRYLPEFQTLALVAGHMGVLLLFVWPIWPANTIKHWQPPPARIDAIESSSGVGLNSPKSTPEDRTLSLYFRISSRPDFWLELAPGTTGLVYLRGEIINGYSVFMPKGLKSQLCFNYLSAVCSSFTSARLFSPLSGENSLADLLGLTVIRVQNGPLAEELLRNLPPDWIVDDIGKEATVVRSTLARSAPLLVQSPKGMRIEIIEDAADLIKLEISSAQQNEQTDKTLILAVPWYPGWRASLNGKPLKVSSVTGLVTAVELPDQVSGELVLSFTPKGLRIGLAVAGLSLLVIAVFLLKPVGLRFLEWRRTNCPLSS